jgi:undecaprenyl-diphosphatase
VILEQNEFKLPETGRPVALALLVGGALFILIERQLRGKPLRAEVTWPVAVVVGIGQLIAAIFPGASRSGSTILLALLLGLNRPAATEFSFLVGIPTMLAAGGLKIIKALHQGASEDWGMIILATVASALVSFAAVKWFLRYVQSHSFEVFGWYRIAVGILILLLVR